MRKIQRHLDVCFCKTIFLVTHLNWNVSFCKKTFSKLNFKSPVLNEVLVSEKQPSNLNLFSYLSELKCKFRQKNLFKLNFKSPVLNEVLVSEKQPSNGTAHIRHQCRKTAVLSCRRFLINAGVEKMNNNIQIWIRTLTTRWF